MQGGLNIIHMLTQVKLYGIAPSLEVYTNWDNCKYIQDTPELHLGFRGGNTVIKIQTMSLVNEDDGGGVNRAINFSFAPINRFEQDG